MGQESQFRVLAALWLVLVAVGLISIIVDLIGTAGSNEGITRSGLVAFFSLAAIAVACALGLLLRKRWGRPVTIFMSAIALILFVPNTIGNLVRLGSDVDLGITLFIVATILVSAYGVWLLVPGKGRRAYDEYSRPADGA